MDKSLQSSVNNVNGSGIGDKVSVEQTGCIGICQYEPVVEIEVPGQDKVTYVKVAPEMVPRIVNDHLVNKNVVTEYTIGAMEK